MHCLQMYLKKTIHQNLLIDLLYYQIKDMFHILLSILYNKIKLFIIVYVEKIILSKTNQTWKRFLDETPGKLYSFFNK